jgi:hypothetical protein
MSFRAGLLASVLVAAGAVALAGCSTKPDAPLPDPNTYPATYRTDLVVFLRQSLTDRGMFRSALIAPPVLKPIADTQRYMVCLQLNDHGKPLSKVAIYIGGRMQQFIDATPDQCGDAVYQPFKELIAAMPST